MYACQLVSLPFFHASFILDQPTHRQQPRSNLNLLTSEQGMILLPVTYKVYLSTNNTIMPRLSMFWDRMLLEFKQGGVSPLEPSVCLVWLALYLTTRLPPLNNCRTTISSDCCLVLRTTLQPTRISILPAKLQSRHRTFLTILRNTHQHISKVTRSSKAHIPTPEEWDLLILVDPIFHHNRNNTCIIQDNMDRLSRLPMKSFRRLLVQDHILSKRQICQ